VVFVDKRILVLLPLLLVAAPALLYHAFSTDEYSYMSAARSFSHGEFIKVEEPSRFPLFSLSLAVPFLVFGANELVAKLVALAFGLAAVLVIYELGRRAYGEEKGFWAALAFSSVPIFAFLSTRVLSESLFLFLFTACMLVLREVAVENKQGKLPLLGALLALLFLARYNGLFLAFVAPIVLWKQGKLNKKFILSKDNLLAKLAFLFVLSPWFYYSYLQSGSPIGLAWTFAKQQQVSIGQTLYMALPDRIPTVFGLNAIPGTTFIATFALLGFPLLLGLYYLLSSKSKKGFVKDCVLGKDGFLFFAALMVTAFVGEVIGFFHLSLLRYIVTAAPFVALLVVSHAEGKVLGRDWKKVLSLLIVLNMVVGLFLVSLFTPFAPIKLASYEKQALHREVGLLASNCSTIASNMRNPIMFYTGQNHTDISLTPECIALSDFEGGYIGEVPSGYQMVFSQGGVRLYRKTA